MDPDAPTQLVPLEGNLTSRGPEDHPTIGIRRVSASPEGPIFATVAVPVVEERPSSALLVEEPKEPTAWSSRWVKSLIVAVAFVASVDLVGALAVLTYRGIPSADVPPSMAQAAVPARITTSSTAPMADSTTTSPTTAVINATEPSLPAVAPVAPTTLPPATTTTTVPPTTTSEPPTTTTSSTTTTSTSTTTTTSTSTTTTSTLP